VFAARRPRLQAVAVFACIGTAACATSGDLRAPEHAAVQPIVVAQAAVAPSKEQAVLDKAVGERSSSRDAQLQQLLDAVRQSLSSPLVAGNTAHLLVDGPATFAAIDAAISHAHHHIHVETYIFSDDDLGRKFAALLIEKRRQGVHVRIIYDAVGSIDTPGSFFTELQDAGVEVQEFRPLNPVKTYFWKFHNRDHRKIIVVDGQVAFTGGLNISATYSSSSSSKPGPEAGLEEGWRDTHVRIAGPVVQQFQKLFLETWQQLGGEMPPPEREYYPDLKEQGGALISAVASSGQKEKNEAIYRTYLAAVRNSVRRIWITQAYFSPPEELRDALIDAVKRSVDVRIIVPGFTDSKLILHASRSEYDALLEGGVRLIEARNALLHAKTALIDDSLAFVGSANLDYRSFLHNNEVTAVILEDETAKRMETIFRRDLDQGKELTLAEWRERPLWQRTKEKFSSLFKFWL